MRIAFVSFFFHCFLSQTLRLFLLTRLLLSPHTVVGPEAYATLTLNPGVHWMNLALSSLAPAFLFETMKPLAGRTAALVGGLLLTLAPLPVLVAATEVSYPAAATLQLAAVAGALGPRITGPVFCLVSSALLLVAGPENIPFVALPMGLLVWKRRWAVAVLVVAGRREASPRAWWRPRAVSGAMRTSIATPIAMMSSTHHAAVFWRGFDRAAASESIRARVSMS